MRIGYKLDYLKSNALIKETDYHLLDAECDLLAAQLCEHINTVEHHDKNHYLNKAKQRIETIGQWGLLPKWEKIANTHRNPNK